MWNELNHFLRSAFSRATVKCEEGQALVEYTLILALVSIAAILTLTSLGTAIVSRLGDVVTAL
jgi:Flp pilus assembly pilin Flp